MHEQLDMLQEHHGLSQEVEVLRLLSPFNHPDELQQAERQRRSVMAHLPDSHLRAIAVYSLGEVLFLQQKIELAIDIYTQAQTIMRRYDHVSMIMFCLSRMATLHMLAGRLHEADNLYHYMFQLLKDYGLEDTPVIGRAYYGRGCILLERGDLTTAQLNLIEAMEQNKRAGDIRLIYLTKIALARLFQAQSHEANAEEMIRSAVDDELKYGITWAWGLPSARIYQARIALRQGELSLAEQIAESLYESPDATLTHARIALYKGDKHTAQSHVQSVYQKAVENGVKSLVLSQPEIGG